MKVILGTDFSDQAQRATKVAASLAAHAHSPLTIVHAVEPGPIEFMEKSHLDRLRSRLQKKLAYEADRVRSAGIEVGSKAAQKRQSEPRHHPLGGLTIARVSTRPMGHVLRGGPGQFFHADFDGLLTPQPVQVLSVAPRQNVKCAGQSLRLDVGGNRGVDNGMVTEMLTVFAVIVALTPFAALLAALAWTNRRERLRGDVHARQVALTDSIHERLGAVAAPVVRRRRRGWQVRVAVPFERPALTEALLAIVMESFGSPEIVLTRQLDTRVPKPADASGARRESPSWR